MTVSPAPTLTTEENRAVIDSYLGDIQVQIDRQRSLAIRYAFGAGLFMVAAFWFDSLWLTVPVYLVFVAWLILRHRAFARRSRVLHRIFVNDKAEGGSGKD